MTRPWRRLVGPNGPARSGPWSPVLRRPGQAAMPAWKMSASEQSRGLVGMVLTAASPMVTGRRPTRWWIGGAGARLMRRACSPGRTGPGSLGSGSRPCTGSSFLQETPGGRRSVPGVPADVIVASPQDARRRHMVVSGVAGRRLASQVDEAVRGAPTVIGRSRHGRGRCSAAGARKRRCCRREGDPMIGPIRTVIASPQLPSRVSLRQQLRPCSEVGPRRRP